MIRVTEYASKTDTGRQRAANEDSYFARAPLFAVADGMGGAQAGEVASRIAAGAFEPALESDGAAEEQLREIVRGANREIHELAQRDSSRAGMGTTLTAAMVQEDAVSFAHVGDSRAYVLRDGELRRLTKDHSLVEELRRQGRLTEEQAEEHPQRSIITRALGPEADVNVDTMTFAARSGDVFLLCSDGLTTMVNEERIKRILTQTGSLRAAVSQLVDAANGAGGRDNITAVAFRVEEGEPETAEGATLIARTAEQAGLTPERMRQAADRLRGRGPMPPPPRRRRALRIGVGLAIVAALIGGAILLARQVYFLGTDEDGRVALFRGLPYELPFGINLYSEQYSIGVLASELSSSRQETVTEHQLRSHDDATDLIDSFEQQEGAQPPQPAPKPEPSPSKRRQQRQQAAQRDQRQSGADARAP